MHNVATVEADNPNAPRQPDAPKLTDEDDVDDPVHSPQPSPTPSPTPTATNSGSSGGGGTGATPSPSPVPTTDISGEKRWLDDDNAHKTRPGAITVRLYANGSVTDATPVWTSTRGDTWRFTFSGVPAVDSLGNPIAYTVGEEPVANYTASVDGTTITNRLVSKDPSRYIDIAGTKRWNDGDNAEGKRPNLVIVRLYRDGEAVAQRTVTAATSWQYAFEHLPADDGYGNVYRYEVREDAVKGYFSRRSGYDFTNTPLRAVAKRELTQNKTGPSFEKYTEQELEQLVVLMDYDTPLWGELMSTGDDTPAWPYIWAALGALALLAALLVGRKRGKRAS